jgi:hypothetical protein
MPRKFRDAVGTAAVLFVLFAVLLMIAPTVRERVLEFAGGGRSQWMAPGQVITDAMASASATALSYAAGNSYLVFFLIVAGLLFFLMLRT